MKLSTQTSYVIDKYGMEEGIRALAKPVTMPLIILFLI